MAASALRRGLLSTVSKYNRKHTHRILSVADISNGFDAYRQRLQCRACGLSGGAQQRRFMSSR
ncbi:polymerase delta-interacting protein 2 isoform X1, partial [Lates japonicus]